MHGEFARRGIRAAIDWLVASDSSFQRSMFEFADSTDRVLLSDGPKHPSATLRQQQCSLSTNAG